MGASGVSSIRESTALAHNLIHFIVGDLHCDGQMLCKQPGQRLDRQQTVGDAARRLRMVRVERLARKPVRHRQRSAGVSSPARWEISRSGSGKCGNAL